MISDTSSIKRGDIVGVKVHSVVSGCVYIAEGSAKGLGHGVGIDEKHLYPVPPDQSAEIKWLTAEVARLTAELADTQRERDNLINQQTKLLNFKTLNEAEWALVETTVAWRELYQNSPIEWFTQKTKDFINTIDDIIALRNPPTPAEEARLAAEHLRQNPGSEEAMTRMLAAIAALAGREDGR